MRRSRAQPQLSPPAALPLTVPHRLCRPRRAAAKRNFTSLQGDDEPLEEEAWSSDDADGEANDKAHGRRPSRAPRSNKKPPAVDDLEIATKEAEAEVAALAPRAAALRQRNEALAAENKALKQRVAELQAAAAAREAVHLRLQSEVARLQKGAAPIATAAPELAQVPATQVPGNPAGAATASGAAGRQTTSPG
jgi:hypothetical protein